MSWDLLPKSPTISKVPSNIYESIRVGKPSALKQATYIYNKHPKTVQTSGKHRQTTENKGRTHTQGSTSNSGSGQFQMYSVTRVKPSAPKAFPANSRRSTRTSKDFKQSKTSPKCCVCKPFQIDYQKRLGFENQNKNMKNGTESQRFSSLKEFLSSPMIHSFDRPKRMFT